MSLVAAVAAARHDDPRLCLNRCLGGNRLDQREELLQLQAAGGCMGLEERIQIADDELSRLSQVSEVVGDLEPLVDGGVAAGDEPRQREFLLPVCQHERPERLRVLAELPAGEPVRIGLGLQRCLLAVVGVLVRLEWRPAVGAVIRPPTRWVGLGRGLNRAA